MAHSHPTHQMTGKHEHALEAKGCTPEQIAKAKTFAGVDWAALVTLLGNDAANLVPQVIAVLFPSLTALTVPAAAPPAPPTPPPAKQESPNP